MIAVVLFVILKIFNRIKEGNEQFKEEMGHIFNRKEIIKEMQEKGIDCKKKGAVKKYILEQKAQAEAKAEEEAKKKEEEAKLHSTEGLLEQIKTLLEEQNKALKEKQEK